MKKILTLMLYISLFSCVASAQTIPDNTEGRLWRLSKIWGYMKYYHPNTCSVQWDSLLYVTIPAVKNAASNTDFNNELQHMLDYLGQIPPALATTVPAGDSNLNLQLEWINDPVLSAPVQDFLNTFKSRAGRNDSLGCRVKLNDYADPDYLSYIDFRDDIIQTAYRIPSETSRLLGLMHHWNTLNYFAPYRNLADHNWDSVLLEVIPEAIAATSSNDIRLVLAKVQSRLNDSHGLFLFPPAQVALPLSFRRIGNKFVVTGIAPSFSGVALGDELSKIEGVPADDIANTYRERFSYSNEATFYRDVLPYLELAGSNTVKEYTFINAAGQPYSLNIGYTEGVSDRSWADDGPSYPVWTTLCNGYGYVNMGLLQPEQVGGMYEELKDKEAIVFDVRRYPLSTLGLIARYLFPAPVISANYFIPDVTAPGRYKIENDSTNFGSWNNPDPYSGKLFFLVNEHTQSHAEYTVQYLSRVPGAKVIGSQTAGADGNINIFPLSAIAGSVYFTGLGWYYHDWYQCQRNGIRIDEEVHPTVAGIRAGRDEVLEYVAGCTTGINRKESPEPVKMTLVPNPVDDVLNLHLFTPGQATLHVSVMDITGKTCLQPEPVLMSGRNGTTVQLNTGGLPAGIYLVKVATGKGEICTRKFVKK